MKQRLSLYELNSMVRDALSMTLPDSYWVEAELLGGARGLWRSLLPGTDKKDERSNTPIAKAHAACWRNRWIIIAEFRANYRTKHSCRNEGPSQGACPVSRELSASHGL